MMLHMVTENGMILNLGIPAKDAEAINADILFTGNEYRNTIVTSYNEELSKDGDKISAAYFVG